MEACRTILVPTITRRGAKISILQRSFLSIGSAFNSVLCCSHCILFEHPTTSKTLLPLQYRPKPAYTPKNHQAVQVNQIGILSINIALRCCSVCMLIGVCFSTSLLDIFACAQLVSFFYGRSNHTHFKQTFSGLRQLDTFVGTTVFSSSCFVVLP